MELNERDIAQIEAYLLGEGTEQERQAFEQRIQSDAAFAEEVKVFKQLHSGIQQHGREAFKAKIGVLGAKVIAQGNQTAYKPSIRPGPAAGGIGNGIFTVMAIGIALAVGGYFAAEHFLLTTPVEEGPVNADTTQVQEPETQQIKPDTKKKVIYQERIDTQKVTRVRQRTLMVTPDGDTIEIDGTPDEAIREIESTQHLKVDSVYTIERTIAPPE